MDRRRWILLTGLAAMVPAVLLYTLARRRRGRPAAADLNNKQNGTADLNNKQNGTAEEYAEERRRYHDVLRQLKERANAHFQAGRYEAALAAYQECLDATAALRSVDAASNLVDCAVRANVVLVFLRLRRPEEARMVATLLLEKEEEEKTEESEEKLPADLKVKVLYRRGLASRALGDVEAALCDFRAAVQLSPGKRNLEAEREIAALTQR